MMGKERLEEIQVRLNMFYRCGYTLSFSYDDVRWLIEQAERVQELKGKVIKLKQYDFETKSYLKHLEQQNKHYREAYKYLKSAIEFDKYMCHVKCQEVVSVRELQEGLVLFEALEGEE